jgi:hypothetical protein
VGGNEIIPPERSFTEVFEEAFPIYLVMGMTPEQFWEGSPELAIGFRRADEIRRRRMNEELWLQGIYVAEALNATVGNMFSKGNKNKYPSEPMPLTEDEQRERREREQKAKMDRIKAAFTAKALNMNAKIGGAK